MGREEAASGSGDSLVGKLVAGYKAVFRAVFAPDVRVGLVFAAAIAFFAALRNTDSDRLRSWVARADAPTRSQATSGAAEAASPSFNGVPFPREAPPPPSKRALAEPALPVARPPAMSSDNLDRREATPDRLPPDGPSDRLVTPDGLSAPKLDPDSARPLDGSFWGAENLAGQGQRGTTGANPIDLDPKPPVAEPAKLFEPNPIPTPAVEAPLEKPVKPSPDAAAKDKSPSEPALTNADLRVDADAKLDGALESAAKTTSPAKTDEPDEPNEAKKPNGEGPADAPKSSESKEGPVVRQRTRTGRALNRSERSGIVVRSRDRTGEDAK